MRRTDDEGSLIPLIAFYFVVAATLILVVTDASRFYLARRSLQSAADGAALSSAQTVAAPELYGGAGGRLRLSGDVCQAVAAYGEANDLATRFDQLTMAGYADDTVGECVADGADHVTVVARDSVKLPLVSILGVLDKKFAKGAPLTVTAHASLRCGTC